MQAKNLVEWRRVHRYSKTLLASALGVHRKTVEYWEKHNGPSDLAARLTALLNKEEPPDTVVPKNAHLRPDLKLYQSGVGAGKHRGFAKDVEHPCRLLGVEHPAPWSVLESEEYKAALVTLRAAPLKRASNLWSTIEQAVAQKNAE